MSHALVNINGTIQQPENAKVSVFDRGFLFGDGVYETGRTYDGCPLFLEDHFNRLRLSASKLAIRVPWTDDELKRELFQTLEAFGRPEAYFRIILTRGCVEHVGLDVMTTAETTRVILLQEISSKVADLRSKGVKLMTSSIIRNPSNAQDPNIKTSNYLNSLLAFQEVQARGGEDAVMCDGHGSVAEGTTFSVFGVTTDGVLITPSLDVGILESITRRYILECAKRIQVPIREGAIPLQNFLNCKETFIASSIREIVPIREWDGHKFPVPGPITAKLYEAFRGEIKKYLSTHR